MPPQRRASEILAERYRINSERLRSNRIRGFNQPSGLSIDLRDKIAPSRLPIALRGKIAPTEMAIALRDKIAPERDYDFTGPQRNYDFIGPQRNYDFIGPIQQQRDFQFTGPLQQRRNFDQVRNSISPSLPKSIRPIQTPPSQLEGQPEEIPDETLQTLINSFQNLLSNSNPVSLKGIGESNKFGINQLGSVLGQAGAALLQGHPTLGGLADVGRASAERNRLTTLSTATSQALGGTPLNKINFQGLNPQEIQSVVGSAQAEKVNNLKLLEQKLGLFEKIQNLKPDLPQAQVDLIEAQTEDIIAGPENRRLLEDVKQANRKEIEKFKVYLKQEGADDRLQKLIDEAAENLGSTIEGISTESLLEAIGEYIKAADPDLYDEYNRRLKARKNTLPSNINESDREEYIKNFMQDNFRSENE